MKITRRITSKTGRVSVSILLFAGFGLSPLQAQVYDNFNFHADFASVIKHVDATKSTPKGTKRINEAFSSCSFTAYLHYSLFYESFYMAVSPQVKMERSRPGLLLKELLFSYSLDALEISLGKTAETRYLAGSRDYLTVRNRFVPFADDFSFWKLSFYVPVHIFTFEAGSKLVRSDYRFEWEGFERAFSKNYAYADLNYRGLSAHLGYAYTYDLGPKNHEHDITAMMRYSLSDILAGYWANLLVLRRGRPVNLGDYSCTAGLTFSPLRALGVEKMNLNLQLFTELIYENEKHSISPGITFYADSFSLSAAMFYNFQDKLLRIAGRIQYDIDSVSFRLLYGVTSINENVVNTLSLGMSYTF